MLYAEKMLWKTIETLQVHLFVFSDMAAKFTKQMTISS